MKEKLKLDILNLILGLFVIRYFKSDSWTICELSDDFNHIILPDNKFIFNDTNVEKLKLNKVQRIEALEYNNLHN